MTAKSRTTLNSDADTNLANNTTGDISPADARGSVKDLADSAVNILGDTMSGALAVSAAGGAASIGVKSEGVTEVYSQRYSSSLTGPAAALRHARGTIASPTDLIASDLLATLSFQGYGGGAFRDGADILISTHETTPGAAAMGARFRFRAAPIGSVTLSEIARLEHATGLSMFGANPVIDQNRIFNLRSYTIATLPAAGTAGRLAWCSDLGGGAGEVYDNGTTWQRVAVGGSGTNAANADYTLAPLTSAQLRKDTAVLTASRTITLSTTGAWPGAMFYLERTGGGLFGLNFGGLITLQTNQWALAGYDGSAWVLFAAGYLTVLGTAALANVGTSGNAVPKLDAVNTWSAAQLNTGQPAFLAYLAADTLNVTGNSVVYTVIFDTEVYDQGSNFNLGTSTFTAPQAGQYQFSAAVTMFGLVSGVNTQVRLDLITTARNYFSYAGDPDAGGRVTAQICVLADMDAGDTVTVRVVVVGGTQVIDIDGAASAITFFSGALHC